MTYPVIPTQNDLSMGTRVRLRFPRGLATSPFHGLTGHVAVGPHDFAGVLRCYVVLDDYWVYNTHTDLARNEPPTAENQRIAAELIRMVRQTMHTQEIEYQRLRRIDHPRTQEIQRWGSYHLIDRVVLIYRDQCRVVGAKRRVAHVLQPWLPLTPRPTMGDLMKLRERLFERYATRADRDRSWPIPLNWAALRPDQTSTVPRILSGREDGTPWDD